MFFFFLVSSKILLKILTFFQLYCMEHIKEKTFGLNLGKTVNHELVSSIHPFIPYFRPMWRWLWSLMSGSKHLCLACMVLTFPHHQNFLPVSTLQFIVFMSLNMQIPFKLPSKRKYIWVCNIPLRFQIQYVNLHLWCENDDYPSKSACSDLQQCTFLETWYRKKLFLSTATCLDSLISGENCLYPLCGHWHVHKYFAAVCPGEYSGRTRC